MDGGQADKRAFAEDRRRKKESPPTLYRAGLEMLQKAERRTGDAGKSGKKKPNESANTDLSAIQTDSHMQRL
jgi:hypothetical protein